MTKEKNILKRLKDNKTGFTLVEVLTVSVIIAILAAVAIPTMGGFVADARRKSHTAEARTVYVAASAAAMELTDVRTENLRTGLYSSDESSDYMKRVKELLDDDMPKDCSFEITLEGTKVARVVFVASDGGKITITGGEAVTYGDTKE